MVRKPYPYPQLGSSDVVVVETRRGDLATSMGMIAAALFASPVVWHHYYLLAAAPALLPRNGPR